MTDITIPPAALEAMRAKLPPFFSESMARAACLAMLKNWPGAKPHKVQVPDDTSDDIRYVLKTVGIILPLPEEASDD